MVSGAALTSLRHAEQGCRSKDAPQQGRCCRKPGSSDRPGCAFSLPICNNNASWARLGQRTQVLICHTASDGSTRLPIHALRISAGACAP